MAGTCAARQTWHDAQGPTKTLGTCVGGLKSVLFHHSEREMGCSRCLKRSYAFQVDRLRAEVIEETNALTQENMSC